MLYPDDIIKNMEKEQEYIEYEYDLNDICNEYNEDDLLLYETGNIMSGAGGIFFLRKEYMMIIIKTQKNYLIN